MSFYFADDYFFGTPCITHVFVCELQRLASYNVCVHPPSSVFTGLWWWYEMVVRGWFKEQTFKAFYWTLLVFRAILNCYFLWIYIFFLFDLDRQWMVSLSLSTEPNKSLWYLLESFRTGSISKKVLGLYFIIFYIGYHFSHHLFFM